MAKLSFLDGLSESQLEYARKVAEKAKEMGIPPDLAISIAYHESRLNPQPPRGTSGEFGIMQVMPATGKGLGYTNKDLSDPDKNIEAGLKYLKQNLDAFGGDPKLATIGYNAGTDSKFFSGGDLPKTTEDYIKAMSSYGAYSDEEAAAPGDMVTAKAPPAPPTQPDTSGASRGEKFLFGGIGAATGALAAGAGGISDVMSNRSVAQAGAEETARIAAQRTAGVIPPAPGGAPVTAPGQPTVRPPVPTGAADAGRMAAGQTGVMPYNYGKAAGLTDIEAGQALDMTKQEGGVHDLSKQRREGLQKVKQMFPGEQYVENPRFGGVMTPAENVGAGPRSYGPPTIQQQAAQRGPLPISGSQVPQIGGAKPPPISAVPVPAPAPVAAKTVSGLDAVTDMFKGMMRPISAAAKVVGKYALPPLAGLSAGLDVADIAHEYDKPDAARDYTKMGLKAASAFGGGLSMYPPAAVVGVPLSLGATAAQAYRDDPQMLQRAMKSMSGKMQGAANIPLLNEMTGPLP